MNNRAPPIDGEEAVLLLHEHWMRFFPSVCLILLSWVLYMLCAAFAYVVLRNHALSLGVILLGHALLLLVHHTAFYRFLNTGTQQYLLTNKRIIGSEQRLWLSDETLDIPLYRIRSVEAREQGILQHLLRFGTIVLNRGELPSLRSIARPDAVHDRIATQVQRLLPASSGNAVAMSSAKVLLPV